MTGEQTQLLETREQIPRVTHVLENTDTDPDYRIELKLGLLRKLRHIASSRDAYEVFLYSLRRRAFTAKMAINELNITESNFYKVKDRLLDGGFIVEAMKTPRMMKRRLSKGGPRPTIFAVEEYNPDDINKALQLHEAMCSKKFRTATRISQLLLEEYIEPTGVKEIKYQTIASEYKKRFDRVDPDILDMTASYLHKVGVKVWR